MGHSTPTNRLRVLCLDIEGGYGGSSRSLFETVRSLDRSDIDVEVWCRREGPIQERYARIGVPCRVAADMPKVSTLPLLSRNLYVFGNAFAAFARARTFRADLTEQVTRRFDLVHFNHEALFLLARWLRPRTSVPFTMHIRTNCWLWHPLFATWQARSIAATIDNLVYITENERDNFERRAGRHPLGMVIYNPVSAPATLAPHPAVPRDRRLRIACLSNYSWYRGVDRLVEVAQQLRLTGCRDVLFVIAGDMSLSRSLPGKLGLVARRGGTLANYVSDHGLDDMFLFLGHVDEPERVLAACDLLAKPTREDNPWGRDILEALAAGRPVLSVGSYDRFVRDGVTGILLRQFDPAPLAQAIVKLSDDRDLVARMGEAGRRLVFDLCDGTARAADLAAVWRSAARR